MTDVCMMHTHVNCDPMDIGRRSSLGAQKLRRACTKEKAKIEQLVAQVEHLSTNMSVTGPQTILCDTGQLENGHGNSYYFTSRRIQKDL